MYVCAYIYIYIWRSRLCSRKLFFDHRNPTKTHTTLLRASSPPMMRRPKIKRALRHRDDTAAHHTQHAHFTNLAPVKVARPACLKLIASLGCDMEDLILLSPAPETSAAQALVPHNTQLGHFLAAQETLKAVLRQIQGPWKFVRLQNPPEAMSRLPLRTDLLQERLGFCAAPHVRLRDVDVRVGRCTLGDSLAFRRGCFEPLLQSAIHRHSLAIALRVLLLLWMKPHSCAIRP